MKLYYFNLICFLAYHFQVIQACKDGRSLIICVYLKNAGKCEDPKVKDLCPLTCDACDPRATSTTQHPNFTSNPLSTQHPTVASFCENKIATSDCEGLKATGKCFLSKVKHLCPVQCDACGNSTQISSSNAEEKCRNQASDLLCKVLQVTGRCVYNDVKEMCPVHCEMCNPGNITTNATEVDLPIPGQNETSPILGQNETSPILGQNETLPFLGLNETCKDQLPAFMCLGVNIRNMCDRCIFQALCPEQCGTCGGLKDACLSLSTTPSTTTMTSAPTTASTTPTTTPKKCADKSPLCGMLAAHCGKNLKVDAECEKTCGLCGPPPATTTTPAASPRMCHQCGTPGGAPCTEMEVYAGSPTQCPFGKSYCMVDVSIVEGEMHIVKRCVDQLSCRVAATATQTRPSCDKFDPMGASFANIACNFCCTKDNCNDKTKPNREDLFKPE